MIAILRGFVDNNTRSSSISRARQILDFHDFVTRSEVNKNQDAEIKDRAIQVSKQTALKLRVRHQRVMSHCSHSWNIDEMLRTSRMHLRNTEFSLVSFFCRKKKSKVFLSCN
ncbi:hypothetical protein CEUSTIGMA_g4419.t1 [Chlamydomonas eustigma]|uniref:Uncharacterized protein n=1 Tax=Chlamydomonas eustigma TaxID=1157962 RepID=A0A250X252_9CHLO|nr:hypothetical protein CEUSTIGMA_g4419.t1 [Chlamydomonas eustigma]|eukprot:GAX76972.1 hypothetical protein CEUSTIGMA_g4419.t1 [Chlamydomonas eustigma]